jgi:hypothetical protein
MRRRCSSQMLLLRQRFTQRFDQRLDLAATRLLQILCRVSLRPRCSTSVLGETLLRTGCCLFEICVEQHNPMGIQLVPMGIQLVRILQRPASKSPLSLNRQPPGHRPVTRDRRRTTMRTRSWRTSERCDFFRERWPDGPLILCRGGFSSARRLSTAGTSANGRLDSWERSLNGASLAAASASAQGQAWWRRGRKQMGPVSWLGGTRVTLGNPRDGDLFGGRRNGLGGG